MNEYISIQNLKKSYPEFGLSIDLTINAGELVSIVGPSGCGKSTTLSLITGLIEPDSGTIVIDGEDISPLPVWERNIGFVFQNYALFPHMDVQKNIAYGLKLAGKSASFMRREVESLLGTVQLDGYGSRDVTNLSGGEQQRIALARAVAPKPHLLLLDEPLSALDAKLRISLRKEIQRIHRELELTTLYVTHDQEEALAISDRIVVMNGGRIEQIGTPEEIYHQPATRFVAEFIGASNIIRHEGKICFFRPESVQIDVIPAGEDHLHFAEAVLTYQEFSGQYYTCTFSCREQSITAYCSRSLLHGQSCTLSVARSSLKYL